MQHFLLGKSFQFLVLLVGGKNFRCQLFVLFLVDFKTGLDLEDSIDVELFFVL